MPKSTRPKVVKKGAEQPKTVRQSLTEVITEVFDEEYLKQLAKDVREMRKGYRGSGRCPDCGSMKGVTVDLPDLTGQLKNLIELIEQAEGRPGTAAGEPGGVTLVIERLRYAEGEDSPELSPAPEAAGVP